MWVVEYFTPSNVPTLENAVRRRGWDRIGPGRSDVQSSIREWGQGTAGGWRVIGPFGPRGSRVPGFSTDADFPPGIASALLELHSVTPGITALLGRFVFDDHGSQVLHEALRRTYRTQLEPIPGGDNIVGPRLLKERASKEIYRALARRCFEWMTDGMSGAFSQSEGRVPVWTFVTLTQGRPLSEDRSDYLRAIGVGYDLDAWFKESELPGLRLSSPTFYPSDDDFMVVAGRVEDLGTDKQEQLHRLNDQLRRTIVTWGVTRLLALNRRKLVEVRHSIALTATKRRGASKRLFEAKRRLLTEVADVRHTALQLRRWADNERGFKYELPELVPIHPEYWHDPVSYPELLRRVVSEQADIADELEAEVRDLLVTSGSVESASANLRVQRTLLWLTAVLVILGGVTIWAAFWLANQPTNGG